MIVILDTSYDLFLCSSWCGSRSKQGVNGHLFEMIEYYSILKNHIKVGILICDEMVPNTIRTVVQEKYDFTSDEIDELLSDIVFADQPKIVKGKNLLVVDGNFKNLSDKSLFFDNIMAFPCNDLTFQSMDNITVLQDNRIYGEGSNTINYIKKILFSRYKDIGDSVDNNLIYATTNSRKLNKQYLQSIEEKYKGNFLLVTNEHMDLSDRFIQEPMPIKNLFEKFGVYIYTPTMNKKDCSPRFVTECEYYNKEVVYEIDYHTTDKGLYWRRYDIEHNFKGLFLNDGDEIINIIKGIIE